jgi:hypothetical protein
MARRGSSFGFMGRFGRSADLRQLDQAMRASDLHPALVPEGVKLAAVNLMKDRYGDEPSADAYAPVADLIAYCMLGAGAFAGANGVLATEAVEERIEAALASGTGLDAETVLLTVHAKLIQPSVVADFGLEAETD